jgi:hypothetical protein
MHTHIVGDNAPADPDNQTNDFAKGRVSTGRNARTYSTVCVCMYLYHGVARLTHSQHTLVLIVEKLKLQPG